MENKRLPRLYNLVLADDRRYTVSFKLNEESNKKLFLEQIDYFTSFFHDENEMIDYLKNNGIVNFEPLECYIIHKHNKMYKTDKIIYNNELINRLSSLYLKSKIDGKNLEKIPYIEEVREYIEYILIECVDSDNFLHLIKFLIPENLYSYICQYKSSLMSYSESFEDTKQKDILKKIIINSFLKLSYREFRHIVFTIDYYSNLKEEESIIEEESTINNISNERIREIYDRCDGDIELMIEEYGENMFEELSKKDQDVIGYTLYRKRKD